MKLTGLTLSPVNARPKLGLIAGNGKFPLLILDAAKAQGNDVVVAAIKEETFPEIEQRGAAAVHWLSLGELSKLIETFQREGVTRAIMAGQVKHKQIFSSIRPDWRLAKLLLSLGTRNTDSLIGAVAKVLADEGITLLKSTDFLEPLLALLDAYIDKRLVAVRYWPDGGNCRSGVRCRGSHGRHGCGHRARW